MVETFAIQILSENKFLDLKEKMLSFLDSERRDRILRFRFQEDAQRSLLGDIMVRSIISKKLNLKNKQITFNLSDKGKPSIVGHPNLFFNISHAGTWVVAAFSDYEVGIDVELIKKINYNVSDIFYSEEENKALNKLRGKKKLEYFFDLWTMKESYLKYTGKGLSEPLNSFTVVKSENKFTLSHKSINKNVFLKQYDLEKGYKLAVCSEVDDFNENLSLTSVEECLKG